MSKISSEKLNRCVKAVLQSSKDKKHNILEMVELQVVLKDYDPQNGRSFSSPVKLQFLSKPNMQVCVLSDQRYYEEEESTALPFMDLVTLKRLNKSKRHVKNLARKYDAYLGPAAIIKQIPRLLGIGLNQAGKFPSALSHRDCSIEEDIRAIVTPQGLKKIYRHTVAIGHVKMPPEELAHNLYLSISYLVSLLKKHWQNVRSLHIKSTLGVAHRLY